MASIKRKNFIPALCLALIALIFLSGCGNGDDYIPENQVSSSDVDIQATVQSEVEKQLAEQLEVEATIQARFKGELDKIVPTATATPTPVPPTPRPTATSTPTRTLDWVTISDHTTFSVLSPVGWQTAVGRGALLEGFITQDYLDQLWDTKSALLFAAFDSESGSNVQVMADLAGLFVEVPKPIDTASYIEVQIRDLIHDLGIDDSAVQQSGVSIDGIKGASLEVALDEASLKVVLLLGKEPRMACGAIAIAILSWSTGDQQDLVNTIFESFTVLPGLGGTLSCDDLRDVSLLGK